MQGTATGPRRFCLYRLYKLQQENPRAGDCKSQTLSSIGVPMVALQQENPRAGDCNAKSDAD